MNICAENSVFFVYLYPKTILAVVVGLVVAVVVRVVVVALTALYDQHRLNSKFEIMDSIQSALAYLLHPEKMNMNCLYASAHQWLLTSLLT